MRVLNALVSQEFLKLRRMATLRAVLISLCLGPTVVVGILRLATSDIAGVTDPGSLVVGTVVILGGIGSAILAAGTFGQEYDLATGRALLLRGAPRAGFLAAKVITLLIIVTAVGLVATGIGLASAVTAGWRPTPAGLVPLFAQAAILLPLSSLVYLAAAALGAVVGRSTAAGMLAGLILFLGGFLLATFRARVPLAAWFPEANLFSILGGDFASALVRDPVSTATAVSRLLTVGAGLLAIAGMLFERQDLTG
ncbi:MAG: ABC transporter permease [Anaerolineales bacterium]|nr:ABC transporter permease [Anaerolineales bacterium]